MNYEIKELLHEGCVEFTFRKANGEERKARGSRNLSWLKTYEGSGFTEDDIPSGGGETSITACPYWDLDKKAWRSVRYSSIISIDKIIPIEELMGLKLFD